jgi:HEAT repeat protein
MEILSPELLRWALYAALTLAVLSLVLLGIIVAVRWQAERAERRTAAFRRHTEPIIADYLERNGELARAVEALQGDPARALDLLMEISADLDRSARGPLFALFAALPLQARETAALHSRRWPRRKQAAERLGYLGDGVIAAALLETLHDPVLEVRLAAARSLAVHGEARAVKPVILAFDLPGAMNQRQVAEIVIGFGPAAIDPLLDVLANRGGHYSNNALGVAVRGLGLLRARTAGGALTELLHHPEFRLRLNAVRSLGLIGDRTAADAVARLADDREWEVRNVVMRTLGQLGAAQHLEVLTNGLRDKSWWVRFSAAQALWQLGPAGRTALTTAVTQSSDRYARDMSRQILDEHGALANANLQPS